MLMPWFVPVAVSVGIFGTWTGLELRHLAGSPHRHHGWWLTVILAWLPLFCWALAQFVRQY